MSTTTAKDRVVTLGRQLYLTTSVLSQCVEHASPRQRDILIELFEAELSSRAQSRARRLLHRARVPVRKTLDGYDWSPITLPGDITREHLTALGVKSFFVVYRIFGDPSGFSGGEGRGIGSVHPLGISV